MLFSVLTATVLPASCLTSRIGLPLATMSAPKSFLPEPCADVPGAIASTGRPFDAAISSDTTFEPATWILPLTSAGTVVAPPCELCRSIFSLCFAKKPFAMPNATNADGTPAVSCTCSVVGPPPEPPPAEPPPRPPSPPRRTPRRSRLRLRTPRSPARPAPRLPSSASCAASRSLLLPLAPCLSVTGRSDTLPGRDQPARDPLPRRLPAPPRDPDALERQRRLRPRQQCRVLLVLRHRHQRVADRGGRPRHPRRPRDRAVCRVPLRVPRAARVSRGRGGGPARRAPRTLERALRDRAVPARGRLAAGGDGVVRPRVRRSPLTPVRRDSAADPRGAGAAAPARVTRRAPAGISSLCPSRT